jgi:1-acylglycerone phosphate reductase
MESPKTALVTGCSEGGIGDAIAQELHGRGYRVFATARDLTKTEHLAKMGLDVLQLDVADPVAIDEAVAHVREITGGKLDMLVNNAGASYHAPVLDTDIARARAMFDVNVWGVLQMTQKFSPLLIESKGTIINIGSIVGELPFPFVGLYCASKAALKLISRTMRMEYKAFDVNVIHVVSGGVNTPLFAKGGKQSLSEDSPYWPARDVLKDWLNGDKYAEGRTTSPKDSARAIISNALSWWPRDIHWYGDGVWPIFFVSNFLWRRLWDFGAWINGFPNLKKVLLEKKAK